MVQGKRTAFSDSALVRLLDQWLAGAAAGSVAPVAAGLADQLTGWLRWTDAMPLYQALQAVPAAAAGGEQDTGIAADCRFVHASLARAIADDAPWNARPTPLRMRRLPLHPTAAMENLPDFPYYRRHHGTQQRAMEDGIAPLRARLRSALAACSPAHARLAAVDAVMERVLGEQERRLLGGLAGWLEQRHACARMATEAASPDAAAAGDLKRGFQQDVQALLRAELELRWQPVAALLAALEPAAVPVGTPTA